MILFHGVGGGGGEFSERLESALGDVDLSVDEDEGKFFLHGEVQTGFDTVSVVCANGAAIEATVIDCYSQFGFNWYVAILRSEPEEVVAVGSTGQTVRKKLT